MKTSTVMDRADRVTAGTRAAVGYMCGSAASIAVSLPDQNMTMIRPYVEELPDGIMRHIAADPTSQLATHFRVYIAEVLLPLATKVGQLIESHAAVAAMPPRDWLENKYPHIDWRVFDGSVYASAWLAYVAQWSGVLALWSAGDFGIIRPYALMPYGGLFGTMTWSQAAAQAKLAMGGEVIFIGPCIVYFIRGSPYYKTHGGMNVTLPPLYRPSSRT